MPSSPVDTITRRFSCRTYTGEPLEGSARADLSSAAAAMTSVPFGSRLRFVLADASPRDGAALKRLGTYGTIRGAAAFIIGAAVPRGMYLEDFGYAMELLVLRATDLGLGTCWIGGFFRRSSFARRIAAAREERIPSVASVGRTPDMQSAQEGLMRRIARGSRRKPWQELFFDRGFRTALTPERAGPFATALEMVRRAPSASNRQPWRIVRDGSCWHFFIRRTPNFPPRLGRALMGIEDLQRVDGGIAMCHFEITARESGLPGRWAVNPPALSLPEDTEYSATWEA